MKLGLAISNESARIYFTILNLLCDGFCVYSIQFNSIGFLYRFFLFVMLFALPTIRSETFSNMLKSKRTTNRCTHEMSQRRKKMKTRSNQVLILLNANHCKYLKLYLLQLIAWFLFYFLSLSSVDARPTTLHSLYYAIQ